MGEILKEGGFVVAPDNKDVVFGVSEDSDCTSKHKDCSNPKTSSLSTFGTG